MSMAGIMISEEDLTRKGKNLPPFPPTGVTIITKQGSDLLDVLSSKIEIMQSEGLKRWSKISARDFSNSDVIATGERIHSEAPFPWREDINDKVALWAGDITSLDCQAIVNSTNETFSDRSALSARMHSKAGPQLKAYIREHLKVCRTGDAKISRGFNLSARYVIHAVGPKYNEKYQTAAEGALFSAYFKVLNLSREQGIRTLGLPAINSIRRGYPPHEGAHMALRVVRKFLEKHSNDFDLIVFAVEDVDLGIYDHLMPLYFPRSQHEQDYACFYLPEEVGGRDGEPVIPERQIRIADKPVMTRALSYRTSCETQECNGQLFDDNTVDLSSGLESSVVVGKTVFAQMQPDVDRRWMSLPRQKVSARSSSSTEFNVGNSRTSGGYNNKATYSARNSSGIVSRIRNQDPCLDDPIAREIKRRNRYERILRNAKSSDFKDFDRLRFLYVFGENDRHGRAVVVIIGQRLPFDGSQDLERLISYFIVTLDHIVNHRPFIVIYFHSLTTSLNTPSMSFMKYFTEILDSRSWNNLQVLYVLHARLWTRLLFWYFSTFVFSSASSSGIKDKLCFLGGVNFLSHLIPIEKLQIPSLIMNHDFKA